ncbi:MAG TPA: SpvB/TcaC N-terminal domain-containing protein, partial [Polyangiaceae bacterium]|nr:SpvB/TcaC N-terminal domain-containing protein [Polyangiaceae bacterium]
MSSDDTSKRADRAPGANPGGGETHSTGETLGLPSLAPPTGGGAVQAIDTKFETNPCTGTASLGIPIASSPGRDGFQLGMGISYDSGAGNGSFGVGWQLGVPAIVRKTDKGLPRYADGHGDQADSDVFVLAGAEDLVPVR